ncbi:MAG: prepilin-type N-terminal cleavage/methylation domain-containing protein [Syntrophales bacterium]|nr:prepilin-type N-terminal cleavage/methylation domain-containing protein [Syntrophales bacterium]
MKRQTRPIDRPGPGLGHCGFTLLEVIVTIVIAAIMGVFFAQFVGTNVIRSADPVYRVQNLRRSRIF